MFSLLLRRRQSETVAAQHLGVGVVGSELRQEEHEAHLLRVATVKQAKDYQALRDQLDATREVAKSTSMAARKVFDDHAGDVRLLLAELRRHAPADAVAAAEGRLSASQSQLAERKRHAQAQLAASRHAEKGAKAERRQGEPAEKKRSFSFGRRPSFWARGDKAAASADGGPGGWPAGWSPSGGAPEASPELVDDDPLEAVKEAGKAFAANAADVAADVAVAAAAVGEEVKRAVRSLSFNSRRGRQAVHAAASRPVVVDGASEGDWERVDRVGPPPPPPPLPVD